jgi:hypothetical protein
MATKKAATVVSPPKVQTFAPPPVGDPLDDILVPVVSLAVCGAMTVAGALRSAHGAILALWNTRVGKDVLQKQPDSYPHERTVLAFLGYPVQAAMTLEEAVAKWLPQPVRPEPEVVAPGEE